MPSKKGLWTIPYLIVLSVFYKVFINHYMLLINIEVVLYLTLDLVEASVSDTLSNEQKEEKRL